MTERAYFDEKKRLYADEHLDIVFKQISEGDTAGQVAGVAGDVGTDRGRAALDELEQVGGCVGLDGAFGILDARLGSRQLIREQQREGVDGAEQWAGANQCIREDAQPAQHGLHLPADDDAQAVLLDQVGHPLTIRGRQRVLHRFGDQPLSLVPHAGAVMQAGYCICACAIR